MATLHAENLKKSYGTKLAVEDVSITVASAEIVGLLGPNGAGKTTCFYMIVGLLKPDAGKIRVDGVDLTKAAVHQRSHHGIGYLPQEASVFRSLTTQDNIRAVLELRKGMSRKDRNTRLEDLLSEFNLNGVRAIRGERLSGGERRRLEIARALASEPSFMLLDEPFAGVDPISVNDIKNEIRNLARRGIGVLITDHNVRETLDICHRAYIVHDHHIFKEGPPAEILADERVRDVYLGDAFTI